MLNVKLKQNLIKDIKKYCIEYGDWELSSGEKTNIYFDTSHIVQTSNGMNLIGNLLWQEIEDIENIRGLRIDGLCAVAINGIPIALATTMISNSYPTIIIDPESQSNYRGFKALPRDSNVAIIEDVLQSGVSVCKAIDRARTNGYNVVCAIALVDREEQGIQRILNETNIPVFSIIKKSELIS